MIELRWLHVTPKDEPVFLPLLSEAERVRTRRLRHPQDRLSYAAAHALLRTMLSEAAGGAPQDWRFAIAPSGKPLLQPGDGWPDLRFNLSHARGMVACVIAHGLEVGVDVEPLDPLPDAERIAHTHFSSQEAEALQLMTGQDRSEAFLHLWTLKEAYLKATGEGVGERMESPQFDPPVIRRSEETSLCVGGRAWTFRVLRPGPFVLSLAFPAAGEGLTSVRCAAAEVRAGGLHALA